MVKWPLLRALVLAGLGMASAGAQNGTFPIVIDYPADGSVFPPDMVAPTFLWRDSAPGAVSWQIDVSFADGSAAIHAAEPSANDTSICQETAPGAESRQRNVGATMSGGKTD